MPPLSESSPSYSDGLLEKGTHFLKALEFLFLYFLSIFPKTLPKVVDLGFCLREKTSFLCFWFQFVCVLTIVFPVFFVRKPLGPSMFVCICLSLSMFACISYSHFWVRLGSCIWVVFLYLCLFAFVYEQAKSVLF